MFLASHDETASGWELADIQLKLLNTLACDFVPSDHAEMHGGFLVDVVGDQDVVAFCAGHGISSKGSQL